MFPPEEQEVARVRLADSLAAVISQRLLPRADEQGRIAALEIMIATPTIRDLIRDRNRVGEIKDYIEEGRDQYGMQSFDQHLMDLVESEVVTFETAKAAASNPADFELKLKTLRRKSRKTRAPKSSGGKGDNDEDAGDEVPEGFVSGFTDVAQE